MITAAQQQPLAQGHIDQTPTGDAKPLPRLAFSAEEVATLFGLSRSSIFALMRKGVIRGAMVPGINRRVITAAEVDRLAATLNGDAA